MAKTPKKSNSSKSNRQTGRPKNTPSKVSFTSSSRRYGCGGKIKK